MADLKFGYTDAQPQRQYDVSPISPPQPYHDPTSQSQFPPQAGGASQQYYTNHPAQPQNPHQAQATSSSNSFTKTPTWKKGKEVFDKGWTAFERLGQPVNRWTNKIGSEAFWPTSLDVESDKAARILKSFCTDGFYADRPLAPGTPKQQKSLVKIPQSVIQNCVGLAIFTTMRTGLWVSGASGSGVLIGRQPDGSWSPPSGLLIHTLGVGFMAGIDIYDCVIVINNYDALHAFSKYRLSLGGEISVTAGPLGTGGILDADVGGKRDRSPLWSYMKSRGLYAGMQVDGTVIVERNDENARFYGERLPISAILAGKVRNVPIGVRTLMEVVKEAEGRKDFNRAVVDAMAQGMYGTPGDMVVDSSMIPNQKEREQYLKDQEWEQWPAEEFGYQNQGAMPTGEAPPAYMSGASASTPADEKHTYRSVSAESSSSFENPPAQPPRPSPSAAEEKQRLAEREAENPPPQPPRPVTIEYEDGIETVEEANGEVWQKWPASAGEDIYAATPIHTGTEAPKKDAPPPDYRYA
ncbi:hypothetical protein BGZ60DRAFT_437985 [Tricladium varicosporioides]|nr:hypothetical protein BGZ60DRAFT_437985 [Hymenoscyphus varicosporioides]